MGEFEEKINIIPQNIENYLQIKWGTHLIFKDSIQFLNSSLAKLAESLDKEEFNHLKHHFGNDYYLLYLYWSIPMQSDGYLGMIYKYFYSSNYKLYNTIKEDQIILCFIFYECCSNTIVMTCCLNILSHK